VSDVLASNGICFLVVGDSKIKGEIIDTGALFTDIALAAGLVPIGHVDRVIRATSKAFNPATSRAKAEHVLLFGKP
jgi:hypothetical protein